MTAEQAPSPPNGAAISPIRYYPSEVTFQGPTIGTDHVDDAPIVIDNGSSQLRAGYAVADRKKPQLVFDNVHARFRPRKATRTYTIVGNDTFIEPGARSTSRSPFEGNIVSNWDVMEGILDYTFWKLGCTNDHIENPVLITEAPANPHHARSQMTELILELYGAPSVAYGVDGLFSFYANHGPDASGLALCSGHSSTHVLPIVRGRGILAQAKRLSWGGIQAAEYLLKLCQLKYSNFPLKVSLAQIFDIAHKHCYVARDYLEEVSTYLQRDVLVEKDRIIQFPFIEVQSSQKSEEKMQIQLEKRKEAGRRLQEQQAANRARKMAEKQKDIENIKLILEQKDIQSAEEFETYLWNQGFADENDAINTLKKLEASVKRTKRDGDGNANDTEPPEFPLLDIPDEELDAENLKRKRQQKLLKASYEARMKIKQQKEEEKLRADAEKAQDVRLLAENKDKWIEKRRNMRDELYKDLKEIRRKRLDIGDRKSFASQMRMKSIASLARNENTSRSKRKRGDDDTFGANDEDWGVYRDINNDSNEIEEAEVLARLETLEDELLQHDDDFEEHMTIRGQNDPKKSLMYGFLHGFEPFPYDPQDVQQNHQLHLNIERIRVPEAGIFQPSLSGSDQASIIEIMLNMLSLNDFRDVKLDMLQNVHVCGGNTLWPGFDERLRRDLTSTLPVNSGMRVCRAADPLLDAWRGAAQWSLRADWKSIGLTRAEWLEKGPNYLKEHGCGNVNY